MNVKSTRRTMGQSLPQRGQALARVIGGAAILAMAIGASVRSAAGQTRPANGSDAGAIVERWLEDPSEYSPLKAVARVVDGKIEGECRFYTSSGALYKIETYRNGVLDGPLTRFFPDGKTYFVAAFRQGTVISTTTWYPTGVMAGCIRHESGEGVIRSTQTTYFRNGRKSVEGFMVDGVYQGQRFHYRLNGPVFGITTWADGQQVSQRIVSQPTRVDLSEIEAVGDFMRMQQRDFWPPSTAVGAK